MGRRPSKYDEDGPSDRLTDRQKAFVLAFVGPARFQWTRAVRLAGLAVSRRSAEGLANRLKQSAKVREAIEAHLKLRQIDSDVVLAELAAVALGGLQDLVKPGSNPPRFDWDRIRRSGRMAALKKIKFKEFTTKSKGDGDDGGGDGETDVERTDVEVEWHDKIRALELLGKALGLWDRENGTSPDRDKTPPRLAIPGVDPREGR